MERECSNVANVANVSVRDHESETETFRTRAYMRTCISIVLVCTNVYMCLYKLISHVDNIILHLFSDEWKGKKGIEKKISIIIDYRFSFGDAITTTTTPAVATA